MGAKTYGFEFICWALENPAWAAALPVPLALSAMQLTTSPSSSSSCCCWATTWLLCFPVWYAVCALTPVAAFVGWLLVSSWMHDAGSANWEPFLEFHDSAAARKFQDKKIPIETVVEMYMDGAIDFKKDLLEVFMHRNEIFRFCFTWSHLTYFISTFCKQMAGHSPQEDHQEVGDVYNRGNDFYRWFLGETMIYTSGMYRTHDDSLKEAQTRKLDTIAKYIHLNKGEKHLDIGCGWGTLVAHFAKNYGSVSTGCTLAEEQVAWGKETAKREGVLDKVDFLCCDYREIPKRSGNQRYSKITCLEMAEHVGIKNFQKFLNQVDSMLEDDGIFYLQIAGLRRKWNWEDLVWGLFMGKYVFPGADASCPLNFVVNQLERSGFEVHRVENMGVHYSLTIQQWYENWKSNEADIKLKYGKHWFRKWLVFLGWSTLIARQGSSTVFMITCNKNIRNDASSVANPKAQNAPFNRLHSWVGPNPVASQQ